MASGHIGQHQPNDKSKKKEMKFGAKQVLFWKAK